MGKLYPEVKPRVAQRPHMLSVTFMAGFLNGL